LTAFPTIEPARLRNRESLSRLLAGGLGKPLRRGQKPSGLLITSQTAIGHSRNSSSKNVKIPDTEFQVDTGGAGALPMAF